MRFSTLLAFAASVGLALAVPSTVEVPALHGGLNEDTTLTAQSGCGSSGPLGTGHYVWYIVVGCTPGDNYTCEVTDSTGCLPGNPDHIGSVEVDDPNDTYTIASEKNTNQVPFVCPAAGQARCQANFNDSDDGPGYSLRVFAS
ncbi:hypothetical protein BN946_scf184851.g104 [Trametes cinnabarina]|uniref:Uncharacterized protein n=1 Tax=Pycnoporus cinnabarinus TaxID=5643 RepID=A0A060S677_PYCCI|nr:hypothetical protein BN946_scf184851.g104 [Trametes cinnabarina]